MKLLLYICEIYRRVGPVGFFWLFLLLGGNILVVKGDCLGLYLWWRERKRKGEKEQGWLVVYRWMDARAGPDLRPAFTFLHMFGIAFSLPLRRSHDDDDRLPPID